MILVTGSYGQLGSEIKALVPSDDKYIFSDIDLDITDKSALTSFFKNNKISFVINCAAYTAVDKAETDIEKATEINAVAPGYLAKLAKEFGFILIHVSTDFVFDGLSPFPYTENSPTNPLGIYGKTKADGEKAIIESGCQAIIIRPAWLYSRYGGNFVKTMLKLGSTKPEFGVIFDQTGTPTWAHDLAGVILKIIQQIRNKQFVLNGVELFHFTNEGAVSWYDFAVTIMRKTGLFPKIKPIRTADYPTPATRPAYSVLDKSKIKKFLNIEIPYWQDSLEKCLKQIEEDSK